LRPWLIAAMAVILSCREQALEPEPEAPPQVEQHFPTPTEEDAKQVVRVFFLNPVGEGLVSVEREIFAETSRQNQVKQAIDLLTIAPDPEEGRAVWPAEAFAREVYLLDDGVVVVDLDSLFTRSTPSGSSREMWMVYSMVATLVMNFDEFDRVQFLVDGRVRETLLGQIDIETPLSMDPRMLVIQEQDPEAQIEVEDLP